MEHRLTREVKELIISRHLIVDVQPHPEFPDGFIAVLDNDMVTDAFETDEGEYVTFTNNKSLIEYVERRKKGEKKMKKYVKIQSSKNIQVTGGLSFLDMTDPKQAVPNKLKVQPLWSKEKIKLKVGSAWYPSYITEWATVKSLNKDGVITIGEFVDNLPDNVPAEEKDEVIQHEQKLKEAKMEMERQKTSTKKLKDIVLDDTKE